MSVLDPTDFPDAEPILAGYFADMARTYRLAADSLVADGGPDWILPAVMQAGFVLYPETGILTSVLVRSVTDVAGVSTWSELHLWSTVHEKSDQVALLRRVADHLDPRV